MVGSDSEGTRFIVVQWWWLMIRRRRTVFRKSRTIVPSFVPVPYLPHVVSRSFGLRSSYEIDNKSLRLIFLFSFLPLASPVFRIDPVPQSGIGPLWSPELIQGPGVLPNWGGKQVVKREGGWWKADTWTLNWSWSFSGLFWKFSELISGLFEPNLPCTSVDLGY